MYTQPLHQLHCCLPLASLHSTKQCTASVLNDGERVEHCESGIQVLLVIMVYLWSNVALVMGYGNRCKPAESSELVRSGQKWSTSASGMPLGLTILN